MRDALDLLIDGRFDEAVAAYRRDLAANPDDGPSRSGLAAALMGAGRYEEAIPLKWQIHESDVMRVQDTCGQLVDLACAYWCTDDRFRAIEIAHGLVAGNLARKINMAPDLAGGCSFGLLLYYMAVSARNDAERDYAIAFLRKLKAKYDKTPQLFGFPKMSVQQLFGDASFEDALQSAAGVRSLEEARKIGRANRARMIDVSVVLFNDGSFRRGRGDETGALERMREVFELGHWADPIAWYLARHEAGVSAQVPPIAGK